MGGNLPWGWQTLEEMNVLVLQMDMRCTMEIQKRESSFLLRGDS